MIVATFLILAGCSSVKSESVEKKLGYEPQKQDARTAKGQAGEISSRLLDWMGVKGRVTEPGAAVNFCEAVDPDLKKYYTIHHPWSVYDLRTGNFEEAMENLRKELPRNGWRITKDGETKSAARNPEIIAVDEESHHTATVEWAKERSGKLKQIITVEVNSRCYRAPEGSDLSAER
jgi:hypothetical protein